MYIWALCRDQSIYDPRTAWRMHDHHKNSPEFHPFNDQKGCGWSSILFNAHFKTNFFHGDYWKGMNEAKNARVVARVVKELELASRIPEPVLILNSSCLSDIPGVVLQDEHCCKHLRELCLKNNKIQCLVKNTNTTPELSYGARPESH